jgi:hypothetical protein
MSIVLAFMVVTIRRVNSLDRTNYNVSGGVYPYTCSPLQGQSSVRKNFNTTITEQSISKMASNPSKTQLTKSMCKNASLIYYGIVAVFFRDFKILIILITNDASNHPLNLMAVPRPPVGGFTGSVTRTKLMRFTAYNILLNPDDLNASTLDNINQIGNASMFVASQAIYKTPLLNTKPLQYYPIPAEGTVGVTISGIGFKVPYSQNGYQSWEENALGKILVASK